MSAQCTQRTHSINRQAYDMSVEDDNDSASQPIQNSEVSISADNVSLMGKLSLPAKPIGIVLFVHGSGSSRHSSRNQYVAQVLQSVGIGTLLFDLLTVEEEAIDNHTFHLRFDIGLLAERLIQVTDWIQNNPKTQHIKIAYFGASTGAAAALVAAAALGKKITAVVSRGGRPDLAGAQLRLVTSPTLLIVGSYDKVVIALNEQASAQMLCEKTIRIVNGASHLFEEPGKLEEVAIIASEWLLKHF